MVEDHFPATCSDGRADDVAPGRPERSRSIRRAVGPPNPAFDSRSRGERGRFPAVLSLPLRPGDPVPAIVRWSPPYRPAGSPAWRSLVLNPRR